MKIQTAESIHVSLRMAYKVLDTVRMELPYSCEQYALLVERAQNLIANALRTVDSAEITDWDADAAWNNVLSMLKEDD